jgi:2-haloacid dehalogenase
LSQLWRTKQLEYTWLRSLMGRYEDFWQITESALVFAAKALGLDCTPAMRDRLMDQYLRLKPFPEVLDALRSLSRYRLAILSNGSPRMLETVVNHGGLAQLIPHVISVNDVKIYKPSPRVYELATLKLGVEKAAIGFVSSNCWDVMGAKSFGFRTYWVNRSNVPADELGVVADRRLESLAGLSNALA